MIDVGKASATALRNIAVALATLDSDEAVQAAYTDLLTSVYLLAYLTGRTPKQVATDLAGGLHSEQWDAMQSRLATITSEVRASILGDDPLP